MCFHNQIDRFNLTTDVIRRAPRLAERGAGMVNALKETLFLHNRHIVERGTDLPEVSGWQWARSGDPIGPVAADTAADHG